MTLFPPSWLQPYKHCVLKDVFDAKALAAVRDEIINNIEATYKETDLFKVGWGKEGRRRGIEAGFACGKNVGTCACGQYGGRLCLWAEWWQIVPAARGCHWGRREACSKPVREVGMEGVAAATEGLDWGAERGLLNSPGGSKRKEEMHQRELHLPPRPTSWCTYVPAGRSSMLVI